MNNYTAKALATIADAIVCSIMIYQTRGASGIGWFVLCLAFIW